MNRIDRLTAILIHLQSKKMVRAQEIADRFEISLRTVYRDIRALEEAGIPVGAEAGKGYFIMEGYHLPPVMFTKEEASAMLTAEKLIEKLADNSIKEHFKTASYKIKSVLHSSQKEFLENLTSHIEVVQTPSVKQEGFPDNFLAPVQNALVQKKVVQLEYYANYTQSFTKRTIEPIGIYYTIKWHLIAFCRLRKDYRDFRLDRIKSLSVMTEQFDNTKHPSLQTYIERITQTTELKSVCIRFNKDVVQYLHENKYFYGFVKEQEVGNQVEMSFLTPHQHYLARWLLMFGNKAEIVSPQSLKELMRKFAAELAQHYLSPVNAH